MEQLRSEIVESEKLRADFLKWKLVIVAALGAVGLGLNTQHGPIAIILMGIPLVCIYVDLLCYHIDLRIQVIGAFFRSYDPVQEPQAEHAYERYVNSRRSVFELEDWVLKYSTRALSIAVVAYGVWLTWWQHDGPEGVPLIVSAVVGIGLSLWATAIYNSKVTEITGSREKER